MQERVRIAAVAGRPESRTLAAVLLHERYREPTGLATFPDGGSRKVLGRAVTFYAADADAIAVRRLVRLDVPRELWTQFDVGLLGWEGERVYAQLSGCPDVDCRGQRVSLRHVYAVDGDGALRRVDAAPSGLALPPNMGIRAPGERVFMRLSSYDDSITVRLEEDGPYVARFRLDASGALVPVRTVPAPR